MCEGGGSGVVGVMFSVPPLVGGCFGHAFVPLLVCIGAPFGMNRIVEGRFSGSFRCGVVFSCPDA